MSEYRENLGYRETLRHDRKRLEAEIFSHRDSLRAAMPLVGNAEDIDGDYVLALAVAISEKVLKLRKVDKDIAALSRELG